MKQVKPKKFLGQHFLKDLSIAKAIADTVDKCPSLPILEVGPGMGVLTQFLITKERTVNVVEIDFESVLSPVDTSMKCPSLHANSLNIEGVE